MSGPAPRMNGKPDFSGIRQVMTKPRGAGGLFSRGESSNSKYFRDILSDFKPGAEPLTAAGAEQLRQHGLGGPTAGPSFNCLPDGVTHADLLPEPFKIIQTPGEMPMLYEVGLDARGHGHREDMRVEERFHRPDFGHLDVAVTITDPKTFTKPIAINFVEGLLPDTDVFEHYCAEDEKDVAHVNKANAR